MALTPNPVADRIAAAAKAAAPAAGSPITDAQLKAIWRAIMGELYPDIQATAVVTIPPGVPVATAGGPTAQTGATTAPGTGTVG